MPASPILNPPSVARDEGELIETILSTLRRGGNVLLPTDASGRVLELLYLLNQHWERHRLGSAYNLCWVGSMVQNTLEFARSQLEWMAEPLGAQFDSGRGHPFALGSVQRYSTVAELEMNCLGSSLDMDNSNPTCVLASGASLDHGPARDLFLKWAENADNAIVFTDSRRCVQRGLVVQQKEQKQLQLQQLQLQQRGGNGGADVGGGGADVGGTGMRTDNVNVNIVGETSSDDVTKLGVGTARLGSGETPSIVQEEEESSNALNIGTAVTMDSISEYSTSGQLLLKWCEAKAEKEEMADVVECDVMVPKRAPLAGAELKAFLKQEEAKRLKEKAAAERRAMLREVELAKGRLRLNEEETGTGGAKVAASSGTGTKVNDAQGQDSSRPKKKSRFDANLFLKYSKPCHSKFGHLGSALSIVKCQVFAILSSLNSLKCICAYIYNPNIVTFEVREEAVGIGQPDSVAKYGIGESIGRAGEVLEDDYGIAVEADRFVDIVTGVDPSKFSKGSGRIGDDVRRRGLGFGADGRSASGATGAPGQDNLDNDDSIDEELALEAQDLSDGTGIIRGRNGRAPVKVSTEPVQLEVLAEIAYVPLEARVDARAARQSIRALQPRQVIILGAGDSSGKENNNEMDDNTSVPDLLSYVVGGRESTFAPTDGETAELSVGHAAYAVRLIDTPYMTIEEKQRILASGDEIPNIEPNEAKVGGCTVSLLDCVATGQKVAADGSIVLAPHGTSKGKRPNVMLSDGDVLLTDLRSEVIALGMKAEYSAHAGYSQLIVNGRVVVRKDQESGQINVEGPLCQDFFKVRQVVCGQYVQI